MPELAGTVEDGVEEVGMRGTLVRGMKSIDTSFDIDAMSGLGCSGAYSWRGGVLGFLTWVFL